MYTQARRLHVSGITAATIVRTHNMFISYIMYNICICGRVDKSLPGMEYTLDRVICGAAAYFYRSTPEKGHRPSTTTITNTAIFTGAANQQPTFSQMVHTVACVHIILLRVHICTCICFSAAAAVVAARCHRLFQQKTAESYVFSG